MPEMGTGLNPGAKRTKKVSYARREGKQTLLMRLRAIDTVKC